jgi:carboxypeptidase Q
MIKLILSAALVLLLFSLGKAQNPGSDEEVIHDLYAHALTHYQGYKWLKDLTDIGGRLAGSPEADSAISYFKHLADSMGFQTSLMPVKVPHWVRGEAEQASFFVDGRLYPLRACALGGSVGTDPEGLRAKVIEIRSFEELDSLNGELEGKIAFFNIPMDPAFINSFFAYGSAVKQRWVGAVEASRKGAAGVVIRSLSNTLNPYPHTGSMTYEGATKKIPAMAISTLDAEALSEALSDSPELEVFMKMNCEWKDSVISHNLIADLPGSESPNEIILVSGHIDSWDLGQGAHDDGAGCMHALEAAWLLKELHILPARTLRVVFFMNEEFGLNGAKEYARQSRNKDWKHVIAIESDGGGFSPRGISIEARDELTERIKEFRSLMEPYGIHQFSQSGSGADISQLKSEDIILIGLRPDSHRYFEFHHSTQDNLEAVNQRELEMGSATLASIVYLLDKYDITTKN